MTALSALEREALRDILTEPDIQRYNDAVVLVSVITKTTLRALETFEADSEDMEPNGDLEPSIGTHNDLEDDSDNDLEFDSYASAPDYSDDPEIPQTQVIYPAPRPGQRPPRQHGSGKPSPVVVNPHTGEPGRIVPVG